MAWPQTSQQLRTVIVPMPLSNIRVIELALNWAGPKSTQVLADMGAEVIKVESIQRMDDQRGMKQGAKGLPRYPAREPGQRPWNRSSHFNQINRNKIGITLDVGQPKGKEILFRLIRIADVVVDNYPFKARETFGITYAQLRDIKPNIIMMSMPGYGMTGPYRDYLGWGPEFESVAGLTIGTGYPDLPPNTPGTSDPTAGLTAAFALLTALYYRTQTGKGQFIDFSHVEASAVLAAESIMEYTTNRRLPVRMGNRSSHMAPHSIYRCKGEDSWVAIAVSSDKEWRALVKSLDDPRWANEERFSNMLNRWENQDELDRLIQDWTTGHDQYQVMHVLQAAGVPAGAVLDTRQVFEDPHLKQRGFFETVTHPEAGTHSYPGMFWKLSKTPGFIRAPAPCLGEHNRYVFGELLGMSEKEIEQLEKEKIIGTEPLS